MIARRSLLYGIIALILVVGLPLRSIAPSVPSTSPKVEKRLLGKWISNREKTVLHHKFKDGISSEKKAKFEGLFGKLKIEFTETEMKTEFEGNIESGPYTVVDSDKDSVVIWAKDFEGPKLIQIHFEDDGYYLLSGYIIEFFKRIPA